MNYIFAISTDVPPSPGLVVIGLFVLGMGITFAYWDWKREAKEGKTGQQRDWFGYRICLIYVIFGLLITFVGSQTLTMKPASVVRSYYVQPPQ